MVPLLNSYGRYLQRTFYAPITSQAMRGTSPLYIEEQITDFSTGGQDSKQPSKKITIGNLEASVDGFISPVFTYRVENGIYSGNQANNQSAGPETMWLAYNDLFHGYGHLLIGDDYPGPMPAFMVNPSDYETAFAIRHLTVGAHSYNLMNTRFGPRFDYEKGPVDLQVALREGSANPIAGLSPSDFAIAPGSDHIVQWKVADAPPSKPWEVGVFGGIGTYELKGAADTIAGPPNIDRYNIAGPYFELDPNSIGKGVPGLYAFYSMAHDSNPGVLGFTTSAPEAPNALDGAIEIVELLFKSSATVTLRDEFSTNGLGATTHHYATGASLEVPHLPYVYARFEVPMASQSSASNGRPTWQASLQYIAPIDPGSLSRIQRPNQPVAVAYAATSPVPSSSAVASSAPTTDGQLIYAAKCSSCHGANGRGTPGVFPAFAGNSDVTAENPKGIIATVKHGKNVMPSFAGQLSNADIAAVLSYIRTTWGNQAGPVTEAEAAGVR